MNLKEAVLALRSVASIHSKNTKRKDFTNILF
jgi:hypothetical protein